MEYPKALYLNGQHRTVDNPSQEDDAREAGFTDWHADAARAEGAAAAAVQQPEHQVDLDVLRDTEARLADWEQRLQQLDEQLTERENELAAREEAIAVAEATLAEKHAADESTASTAAAGADNEGSGQTLDREALKARATELNIEFARNVTTEKLAELVATAEAQG